MMAAEKWASYQESYERYGLDLAPQTVRAPREKKNILTARDRGRLLVLAILCGLLAVGVIIATAYAAKLQYDINTIISENTEIEGEIQNLKVKLEKETNIAAIEEKAIGELGMVYPSASGIVYIEEDEELPSDFAMLLKEEAYN